VTALDRLVERRGRAGAARQFARWRATDLIDQTIDRSDGRRINSDGQWLLNFASCDYLGLAQDPRIAAACCAGVCRWACRERWAATPSSTR
jgi:7-keto-8-aminopelargonate synthetase-like enzyme